MAVRVPLVELVVSGYPGKQGRSKAKPFAAAKAAMVVIPPIGPAATFVGRVMMAEVSSESD